MVDVCTFQYWFQWFNRFGSVDWKIVHTGKTRSWISRNVSAIQINLILILINAVERFKLIWLDLIFYRYYCGCCGCCCVLITVSIFPSSVVLVTARTMSKNQVYCPQIILNWYRHFFLSATTWYTDTLTRAARIRSRSNVLRNSSMKYENELIFVSWFESDQHLITSTCMQIHADIHNWFVYWHIQTIVNE